MTEGLYEGIVMAFDVSSGTVTCLIPQRFGQQPQTVLPALSRPSDVGLISPLSTNDRVLIFFPGSDDSAPRWLPTLANATLGGRNILPNGEMMVYQRASILATATGTDSWVFSMAASAKSITDRYVIDLPAGVTASEYNYNGLNGAGTVGFGPRAEFPRALILQPSQKASLVAGDSGRLSTRLDGISAARLMKGTASSPFFSFSFVALVNTTQNVVVEVEDLASGRKISRLITLIGGIRQRYTCTFPGDTSGPLPSTTAAALQLSIWWAAGSTYSGGSALNTSWTSAPADNTRAVGCGNLCLLASQQFDTTGWQLEIGYPTAFEHRPLSTYIADCRRYLMVLSTVGTAATGSDRYCSGQWYASNSAAFMVPLQWRTMLASPSITTSAAGTFRAMRADGSAGNDFTSLTVGVTPSGIGINASNGSDTGVAGNGTFLLANGSSSWITATSEP